MIPKGMHEFLHDLLPEHVWKSRRKQVNGLVFLEFTSQDVELLHRLGIEVDDLGPRLVACMWDETSPIEIGGYLVVDNVAMGLPSMGGIRLSPEITPATIHNLARGMTMKNAAADLPYGGGKSGVVASTNLSPSDHAQVIRGFAHLLQPYARLYNPGPDVGTNDQDMKTIAIENGLDVVVSKPAEMGGNRIDQLGAAAGGVVIALETLHHEVERLRPLAQFRHLEVPAWESVTVIVQGFGAVGANVSRILWEQAEARGSGPRVIGISDAAGYLHSDEGLDVGLLLKLRGKNQIVSKPYFLAYPDAPESGNTFKFSNARDDLLRESAFAIIPAAPQANYLDVDDTSHPSMTVDAMGHWSIIVEGANTYSPDPRRKAARRRMERQVYQKHGTLIATDFLVNSGGVIFAAHERLLPTPPDLRLPDELLGHREAVETWLKDHAKEFAALAEQRRAAAEAKRAAVIHENMVQLVDGLVADDDALPCQVAERISINRIVRRESRRLASELMVEMADISVDCSIQEAARHLVEKNTDILSVIGADGQVVGIVTDWDITRAAARESIAGADVDTIMSRDVVSAAPQDNILDIVRKFEYYNISAVPVLSATGQLLGVVTTDILAKRTLYRLLLGEQQT